MLGLTAIGYFMSVVMGITLGLIGGGGSILTFPVLVYFFGVEPKLATSYSLFIVGLTSMVGAAGYFKNKQLSWHAVLAFGLPSVISIFITKNQIYPNIPQEFNFMSWTISKNIAVTILFAILMVLASYFMIRPLKYKEEEQHAQHKHHYFLVALIGIFVGFLAGLVGAGGGFLIIPSLVILMRLPMKMSIGTSLVIIFLNSLIGFVGGMSKDGEIAWNLLISLSALSILGIIVGLYLAKFIPGPKLKPAFGWFVLVTGCIILLKEFI